MALSLSLPGSAETGKARVRVVHAASETQPVDLLVNDTVVASNVAFLGPGDYLEVPAGEQTLIFVPNGQGTKETTAKTNAKLENGKAYTVVLMGLTKLTAEVYEDDLSTPPPGMAKVRAIHASSDAPTADIQIVNGPTIIRDLTYTEATEYQPFPAGKISYQAIASNGSNLRFEVKDVDLQAGTIYDIVVAGQLSNLQVGVCTYVPASGAAAHVGPGDQPSTQLILPNTGLEDAPQLILFLTGLVITITGLSMRRLATAI